MYQLTALYRHPEDPAAFEQHYREVHAPLAARFPGLTGFTMTWTAPGPDGSRPAYALIAVLQFASQADLEKAMAGPEGTAAVADLATFAGAGVDMVFGATETVV